MNKFEIDIDFEKVNFSELETEEDFRSEAKKILPAALFQFGETVAFKTWEEMQEKLPGKGSQSEKRRFIQETGKNYQRKASNRERQELEDYIVERLRQYKS